MNSIIKFVTRLLQRIRYSHKFKLSKWPLWISIRGNSSLEDIGVDARDGNVFHYDYDPINHGDRSCIRRTESLSLRRYKDDLDFINPIHQETLSAEDQATPTGAPIEYKLPTPTKRPIQVGPTLSVKINF